MMLRKIRKYASTIIKIIYCRINPVGYAKSLGVKIGDGVCFYSIKHDAFSTEPWLITIGNNVHITADVRFLTHDGGTLILKKEMPDPGFVITGNIVVGNDTYIGIRSIILPGVKIGNRCIIGCGSIVTKDIPDNSVAVGVPAKVIGTVDGYLDKIKDIMDDKNPRYYSNLDYMHSLNPKRKIKK